MEIILFALLGWLVGVGVNRAADHLVPPRPLPYRALLVEMASALAFVVLWMRYVVFNDLLILFLL